MFRRPGIDHFGGFKNVGMVNLTSRKKETEGMGQEQKWLLVNNNLSRVQGVILTFDGVSNGMKIK